MVIKGNSYDCCSACSKKIISTYQSEGWHFIKRALNERGYVEGLSGLAEVGQLIRIMPRSAKVFSRANGI
jgi:ubiquitin-like modifier-activating enzyme ATG7